jgi:hypothetical protein
VAFWTAREPVTETAVLIEKRIERRHDDAKEIKRLWRMRYGMFPDQPNQDRTVHRLVFQTKKGPKTFYVEASTYHGIPLDALGDLTHHKGRFVSFRKQTIATRDIVAKLNW